MRKGRGRGRREEDKENEDDDGRGHTVRGRWTRECRIHNDEGNSSVTPAMSR